MKRPVASRPMTQIGVSKVGPSQIASSCSASFQICRCSSSVVSCPPNASPIVFFAMERCYHPRPVKDRLALLLLVVAVLLTGCGSRENGGDGQRDAKAEQVAREMRERLLEGTPAEFSVTPDGQVWGVLLEIGFPEACATLVSLADGSASLHFSNGGGMTGGGEHPEVAAAAKEFVHAANEHLSRMTPAHDFPLARDGQAIFYVLTTNGVFTAEADQAELGGIHALTPLFALGNDVVTELREASGR